MALCELSKSARRRVRLRRTAVLKSRQATLGLQAYLDNEFWGKLLCIDSAAARVLEALQARNGDPGEYIPGHGVLPKDANAGPTDASKKDDRANRDRHDVLPEADVVGEVVETPREADVGGDGLVKYEEEAPTKSNEKEDCRVNSDKFGDFDTRDGRGMHPALAEADVVGEVVETPREADVDGDGLIKYEEASTGSNEREDEDVEKEEEDRVEVLATEFHAKCGSPRRGDAAAQVLQEGVLGEDGVFYMSSDLYSEVEVDDGWREEEERDYWGRGSSPQAGSSGDDEGNSEAERWGRESTVNNYWGEHRVDVINERGVSDAVERRKWYDNGEMAEVLIHGLVTVLQLRMQDGRGPLPLHCLDMEFTKLWRVPFAVWQAGEVDTVVFLSKWPGMVRLSFEGDCPMVSLAAAPSSSDAHVVFGEAKIEDLSTQAQANAAQQFAQVSNTSNIVGREDTPGGEIEEEGGEVDENGIKLKDIELVVSQVECSHSKAVAALKANNNDIVEAIMQLSSSGARRTEREMGRVTGNRLLRLQGPAGQAGDERREDDTNCSQS